MVRIHTDHPQYLNDIADEVRLFAGREGIVPAQADASDVSVTLREEGGLWLVRAFVGLNDKRATYTLESPACFGEAIEVKRQEKRAMKIAVFRALREVYGFTPPWGSLTGIRPTRLLRELIQRDGEAQAIRMMTEDFDVSAQKLALARCIVGIQDPLLSSLSERDADVYVNIPFCLSKCLYCSFPSKVRTEEDDMEAYLAALERDISHGAEILQECERRVRAIYVGGGTPTVLTANELSRMLTSVLTLYGGFGREFTVEAGRPDTITREKLGVMKRLGVTRISVNPQTMNDKTLNLIGRKHSAADTQRAFDLARDAGFTNINMDVIAGLPGESVRDMEHTLEELARLAPESLTVHTLALKRASRLVIDGDSYAQPAPCDVEEMVHLGAQYAHEMGMKPYYMYRQKYMSGNLENVGYAKPEFECIYNIDMMEDAACIMAHGAGSMTKCVYNAQRRLERVPAPKDINTYAAKVETLAADKRELFVAANPPV